MKKIITLFFFIFPYTNSNSENIKSCNFYTEKYGKAFNLPNNLLTSISLVESGIKKEKNGFSSWPWTLNVSGKSIYFDRKEDVLNYLEKNADKKSIDVGCMQINTKYHLNNFENVSQMIEPEQNAEDSEHRNVTTSATSSAVPSRFTGKWSSKYFCNSIPIFLLISDYL